MKNLELYALYTTHISDDHYEEVKEIIKASNNGTYLWCFANSNMLDTGNLLERIRNIYIHSKQLSLWIFVHLVINHDKATYMHICTLNSSFFFLRDFLLPKLEIYTTKHRTTIKSNYSPLTLRGKNLANYYYSKAKYNSIL